MLRIIEEGTVTGVTVLRIEGKAVGRWVDEFERAADEALALGTSVTVDLGGLAYADADGVALLKNLAGRSDVMLVNCSAFTAAQLRGVDTDCARGRS